MTKLYTFPHYEIDVDDESATTTLIQEQLALHVPMFLSFAERGPINTPVYGTVTDLKKRFGAGTFDMFSPYYQHPNVFLEAALPYQSCFFVRVAPVDAATASIVLQCSVYTTDLIQYQVDSSGQRILTDGNPTPIDDGAGDSLTAPGVVLKWSKRALLSTEDPAHLVQSTSTIPDPHGSYGGTIEVTTYPILILEAQSPGAWGNSTGITLSWNPNSDPSVASAMKSLILTLGISSIAWGSDTPTPVRTVSLDRTDEFTFATNTTDLNTMRRYYLNEVIANDYGSTDITFNVYAYPTNVAAIGTAALLLEGITNFPELTSPFMVNLFTGKTIEQQYYNNIQIDTSSTDALVMADSVINYMIGGSDGTLSAAALETLTATWFTGDLFPAIQDHAQYPITHLWDSGYSMATKEAMIDFLGVRDDIKVMLSTQEVSQSPNTMAEDQSAGSFLRARALLLPESTVYGTGACRATIFQQCGNLNKTTPYTKIVPATLDSLVKKGMWEGATFMKGKPKGRPNSEVTVLKNINWVPIDADMKQLSWDSALNYMQYCDMTTLFYPDVISVYNYLTSLLSDDIYVDMLIFIKHIVAQQWTIFSGVEDPIAQLIGRINTSVGNAIYNALGNNIRCVVNAYQTPTDKSLGYQLTVEVDAYGTMPNRVWKVIEVVRRETTTTTA